MPASQDPPAAAPAAPAGRRARTPAAMLRERIEATLIMVFLLEGLTAMALAAPYLRLGGGVMLAIAFVNGALIVAFFMRLTTERRTVFAVLALTVVLFVTLLGIPYLMDIEGVVGRSRPAPKAPAPRR